MSRNQPLVGVMACGRQVEGEPAQAVKHRYLEAVARFAGAVPVIVPSNLDRDGLTDIVSRLDAVLLTGSNSNIDPQRYGSAAAAVAPVDPARDLASSTLVRAAIADGTPVFGICRGLQEINVALGGTLRDLRTASLGGAHHARPETPLAETFAFAHGVDLAAHGLLQRITGEARLMVNSVHWQAIDVLAEGLAVEARAADGVIEAIAARGSGAPVVAVQWHPEWRAETRPHDLAFWRYLGETARRRYDPAAKES